MKKTPFHFLLALTALGFALRLYALGRESLWFDELLQLDIAQASLGDILPQLSRHTAMPLDYVLTHFWILGGRQEAWVRLPAVIFGMLTLPLTFQLGRSLFGRTEGMLFMALFTLSPFHIRYSQEARPYALGVLGVILTAYAFWQFRRVQRRGYLAMLQLGVLMMALAHLFALFVFIPFVALAVIDLLIDRAYKPLAALLGTGLAALIILLSLGWGEVLFYSFWEFSKAAVQPEKFTAAAEQKPNQGNAPEVNGAFIKDQLLAPLGAGENTPALSFFNLWVGLGAFYLLWQKKYRLTAWLGLWLVAPIVIIVAFLVYRGTFFAPRYIIATLPAYLGLLTVGLLALPRWFKRMGSGHVSKVIFLLATSLVMGAMAGGLWQFYQHQKNEDWRLLSRFLARNVQPGDAIIAVNAESTLNWYYPPAQAKVDSFDTLAAVQNRVVQSRRSWVILSIFSVYLRNEYSKIKAWVGEQGAIHLAFDPVIDVYYLGPTASQAQLLNELQGMALPVNHAIYASLARENRHNPAIARRYYELALEHAPDETTQAQYRAALEALNVRTF
jgi:hypothetical protein